MPFAPNYKTNPDWSKYPEGIFTRIDKGIQAHSAALGITFFQDSKTPEPFREGIAITLHGSWDRSRKTGYKVIFFPWQGGRPGKQIDLVAGWLDDKSQKIWGRPVDGFICSNKFLGPFGDVEACAKRGDVKAANQLWLNHTLFAPARENPAVEHKLAEMVGDYSGWHWANKDPIRPSDPPAIKCLHQIRALVVR
jgi:hypothetical protein